VAPIKSQLNPRISLQGRSQNELEKTVGFLGRQSGIGLFFSPQESGSRLDKLPNLKTIWENYGISLEKHG